MTQNVRIIFYRGVSSMSFHRIPRIPFANGVLKDVVKTFQKCGVISY